MLDLQKARDLAEAGELDEAWQITEKALQRDPDDVIALVLGTYINERAKRLPVAYHFARRVTELQPSRSSSWTNFGRCADQMWLYEESERAYRKAIQFSESSKIESLNITNLAALYINHGEFAKAEPLCDKAIQKDPDSRKAKANKGFCLLARRKWAEGWKLYAECLGSVQRRKTQYGDEPEWQGEEGKRVVIYGEQGLGDEISFASMIPDACKRAKIIVDCDHRLQGLFQRSFPDAIVHGTRNQAAGWSDEFDCSAASGSLGGLFRNSDADFTGAPYLVADPDRVTMWRALWASKGKPVIGVAWSGGMWHTGAKHRKMSLEDFLPLFKSVDAHFVCLQYTDAQDEIDAFRAKHPDIDLKQYPYATLTSDYDDTAALVASLDHVMAMQTAVVHLAGGLGVPCEVIIPMGQWRYGEKFDNVPWYRTVRVWRKGKDWPVKAIGERLHADYSRVSGRAAKAA